MITLGDLILQVMADDSQLGPQLQKVEAGTQSWVKSFGGALATGLGAVVAAGIGAAVAGGMAAFNAGNVMDDALDSLLIKTGANGEQLQAMGNDVRAVFGSIPTTAGDAATAISMINQRLGLTGTTAQDAATRLLEMSRLTGGDLIANGEAFTRMMGDWGISSEGASSALDGIFVASQQTGIGADRLMSLVTQFGAPMRQFGFSWGESTAMLAKWEKEGVNAELVMGSMRTAAGKFANENKPLRQGLEETFTAIKNAKDESGALALAMDVFGARAGPDMAAAIREGRFELGDLVSMVENGTGAIMDASEQTAGWQEKLQLLKNRATLALEPLGAKMLDVASVLLDKAIPAVEKLADVVDTYMVPAFESFVGIFDGSTNMGEFGAAFERLRVALAPVAETLMTNFKPAFDATLLVLQQIGGEVMTFLIAQMDKFSVWLVENGPLIDAFSQVLSNAWINVILPALQTAWSFISPILDGLVSIILDIGKFIMQVATGDWAGAWETIKSIGQTAYDSIKLAITNLLDGIAGIMGTSLDEIKTTWQNNWDMLVGIVGTIWEKIKEKVSTTIENVKSFFKNADWGAIGKGVVDGIATGIKNGASAIANAAITAAKAALAAAKEALGINSPSRVAAEQVGKPFAQGVGIGIEKNISDVAARIPAMLSPMLSPSVLPQTAPVPSQAASRSNTVNLYATHVDTNSVARAVRYLEDMA